MRTKTVIAGIAAAVAALLVTVVAVVVAVITAVAGSAAASCTQVGSITAAPLGPGGRPDWWNTDGHGADRDHNAGIIIAVVRARQLPDRAAVIALATAVQESKLINLPGGDQDSEGFFQQRVMYYGPTIPTDPVLSTRAFLGPQGSVPGLDPSIGGLLDVPNWQQLPLTVAAQSVQRSGYPDAYAQWEPLATELVQSTAGSAASAPSSASSSAAPALAAVPAAGTSSSYDLGAVQPQTAAVANAVGLMFHIKDIGGYRSDGDAQDHATGLALDFMVYDDHATGQALADYLQAHAPELGVSYVIWAQHIWNVTRASEGWRLMPDRGSPTANHMDHVHLSLTGTGPIPTNLPAPGSGAAAAAAACTTADAGLPGVTGLPSDPTSPFKDGTPDPTPLPRPNPRTVAQAIAWMQTQQQTGTTGWHNRCLASVGLAYGWNATGVEYAIDAYTTLPAQYRHDGDRNPPVGSLLFWTTSGRAGHVAIYVGGGMIATTDIPTDNKIGIVPATAPETQWGGTYVGWTPPYFPHAG